MAEILAHDKSAQFFYDAWYEMYRLLIDLPEDQDYQVEFIQKKIQTWMDDNEQQKAKKWWKRFW